MIIKKLLVKNYKSLSTFELPFNSDLNIIVGNNESGKSTVLEAINLVLTGQLNGRSIAYELSPYLFNKKVVEEYVASIRDGRPKEPPKILIELYLEDSVELAVFKGSMNSKREDATGLYMCIQFNEEFIDEYKEYIKDASQVRTVPSEYYEIKWYSFANHAISIRSLPIKTTLIDTTSVRLNNGTDSYVQKTIDDILEQKEQATLSLLYRKLKESFAQEESIKEINKRLKANKDLSSHKEFMVSLDISQKTNWDASLTSYLDDIPFRFIGKGDQNILKMLLALERKKSKDSHVILIEEPENHLSFSKMHQLVKLINEKCAGKQLIITTHNAFILNKLGLEKLILLGPNLITCSLKDLPSDTQLYFKKLPGYDTLRLVLSLTTFLVEGPSEELFIQKAYLNKRGKLPIEDGIDIISVRGLSFKRFLDIAKILKNDVVVFTDNDGNCKSVETKYKDYEEYPTIRINYDSDENYPRTTNR